MKKSDILYYKRLVWFWGEQKEMIKSKARELGITENEYLRRLVSQDNG